MDPESLGYLVDVLDDTHDLRHFISFPCMVSARLVYRRDLERTTLARVMYATCISRPVEFVAVEVILCSAVLSPK